MLFYCRRSLKIEVVASGDTSSEVGVASLSRAPYSFVPVDRYGDNRTDMKPLEDKG